MSVSLRYVAAHDEQVCAPTPSDTMARRKRRNLLSRFFFYVRLSLFLCVYQGLPIFIGYMFVSVIPVLLSSSFIILRMRLLARNVVVDD